MQKIRINGLKLSPELVRLTLEWPEDDNTLSPLVQLCRLLSSNKINIVFMSTAISKQKFGLCCIDSEQHRQAVDLIERESRLKALVGIFPGAGVLTLFPHQSSLRMVGVVLQKLGEKKIPVYGLASSIAAISFLTDYCLLDNAADLLGRCLDLPASAAPAKSILKVRPADIKP